MSDPAPEATGALLKIWDTAEDATEHGKSLVVTKPGKSALETYTRRTEELLDITSSSHMPSLLITQDGSTDEGYHGLLCTYKHSDDSHVYGPVVAYTSIFPIESGAGLSLVQFNTLCKMDQGPLTVPISDNPEKRSAGWSAFPTSRQSEPSTKGDNPQSSQVSSVLNKLTMWLAERGLRKQTRPSKPTSWSSKRGSEIWSGWRSSRANGAN